VTTMGEPAATGGCEGMPVPPQGVRGVTEDIQGVILDIDGVLEFRGQVYPGAIQTVAALRDRGLALRFLTNSTMKSRKSCAETLRSAGFAVSDDEVITASYAAAAYLAERQPRSCWVLVDGEGVDEFAGLVHDPDDPEYIVLGDNRNRFDFEILSQALRLLLNGSKLIVMQPELVDRSQGLTELNVGAWGRMLEQAAGIEATYLGKPNPYVFELTLSTMGLARHQVLMVGDQVGTDIKGANDVGIRSILLRTGEFNEKELVTAQPDLVFSSIAELGTLFR
jgi:HAD superfamily hydrolase (TIGR01458 family)